MTALEDTAAATAASATRHTWGLWGAAAGLGGLLTNMFLAPSLQQEVRESGDPERIFEALSQTAYHVTAVTGFVTIGCLLVFAAGFARWGAEQHSRSLSLRVAPAALVASAAALIAGYGIKGQLASYLPGGFNSGSYDDATLYHFFLADDLAGYFGWWGVAFFFAALAVMSFRERLVPRWIGVVAVLAVLAPTAFLVLAGFTGFPGVICPAALLLTGLGMARQRS